MSDDFFSQYKEMHIFIQFFLKIQLPALQVHPWSLYRTLNNFAINFIVIAHSTAFVNAKQL